MSTDVDVWRLSADGPVRSTLARYLERDPGSVELADGPYGKPRSSTVRAGVQLGPLRRRRRVGGRAWTGRGRGRRARRTAPRARPDRGSAVCRRRGRQLRSLPEEGGQALLRVVDAEGGVRQGARHGLSVSLRDSPRPGGSSATSSRPASPARCVRRPAPYSDAQMTVRDVVKASTEFLTSQGTCRARAWTPSTSSPMPSASRGSTSTSQYDRPLTETRRPAVVSSSAGAAREPLAYILGEWGFRRLTLKVDRARSSRGRRRRSSSSAAWRCSTAWTPRPCSTSARAQGRSRSPSRTSGRTPRSPRSTSRGRARARQRERGPHGARGARVARAPRRRGGTARRALRPRRLQPAVRRVRAISARSSPRSAIGSPMARSSGTA